MANELQFENASLTGSTLYVVVWNDAGDAWTGSAFATYTTTRGDFDVAATEIAGTGFWQASMVGSAGWRRWAFFLRAGGSPSHADDVKLLDGTGYWDGTRIVERAVDASGNAIATLAEQAKIPKSDGTVAPNATAIAAMQSGLATGSAMQTIDDNVDTMLSRLTSTRASYLDKLNITGNVASQPDVQAINASSSRHLLLLVLGQFERPESGSTPFTIEARTYDVDGAPANADETPTLTVTGSTSGNLAANLGSSSNPDTGVYLWTYTVQSVAVLEQLRITASATVDSNPHTLAAYSQICDFVAATFTTEDRSDIQGAKAAAESAESTTASIDSNVLSIKTKSDQLDFTGTAGALKSEATNMRGTDDALLATSYTAPLTAQQHRDAMKLAPSAGAPASTSIDGKIDDIEVGSGGGTIVPVNQVAVPLSRTWILKPTDDGLKGESIIGATLADIDKVYAVDYRNDLPANGRLIDILEVELIEGDVEGITLGADINDTNDYGVDRSQAKLRISPVEAGAYVLGVTVEYDDSDGGGESYGEVAIKFS